MTGDGFPNNKVSAAIAAGILRTGQHDPTVTATEGPAGAIYLRQNGSSSSLYEKLDDGTTTNWQKFSTAGGLNPTGYKNFYVDKNRTDTYVADGSIDRPFKTIMGAVNQVIANGDNSNINPYMINVIGVGNYEENVDIGNSAIVNIIFDGASGANILPLAGNAIQSLANNNLQGAVQFSNFELIGDVNFTNPTDNGQLGAGGGIQFINCGLVGSITLNNVFIIAFITCAIELGGNLSITNVFVCEIIVNGTGFYGTVDIVTNNLAPKPFVFFGTQLTTMGCEAIGTFNIGVGSSYEADMTIIIGLGPVTIDGTLISRLSNILSDIVINNGGTYDIQGASVHDGALTINPGGVYTASGNVETQFLQLIDGHIKTFANTPPTVTPDANAGVGATLTASQATDVAGLLELDTGAGPASGIVAQITFTNPYDNPPIVILTPANQQAADLSWSNSVGIFVTRDANGFQINSTAALPAGTPFQWNYHVIGSVA